MNKSKFIIFLLTATLLISASAYSKKPKPRKTPRPTVASVTKKLNDANDRIGELSAQNVSLTARVSLMDADMKKIRKDSDARFYLVLGCGAGALVICIAIIMVLAGAKTRQRVRERRLRRESSPVTVVRVISTNWSTMCWMTGTTSGIIRKR